MRSSRLLGALAGTALVAGALAVSSPAAAASALVTNDSTDPGTVGSFPWAVEQANGSRSVTEIVFQSDLTVTLDGEVTYTGPQRLRIVGNGATLEGDGSADTDAWGSGLFVSRSDASLTIEDLNVVDSFNNGLAVFIPEGGRTVRVSLHDVTVTGSQFHGVLVDGQATSGYNTDDFIHPGCTDPYPVDAGASIVFTMTDSRVDDNGRIVGYDISQATGCPQDFDGVRVDQGGAGSLGARIDGSTFEDNLADGVELDETGSGSNTARLTDSVFRGNGATAEIECTVAELCGSDTGEMIEDLDDAFDMDEADGGNLSAYVSSTDLSDNLDEGLDLDEAGSGSVNLTVNRITANRNTDEGVKVTEEDDGDIRAYVNNSNLDDSNDSDNAEFEEFGNGNNTVVFFDVSASGAGDGDGLKVEEEDAGSNRTTLLWSTFDGNDDEGVQTSETGEGNLVVTITGSSLSDNDDSDLQAEQEGAGRGSVWVATSLIGTTDLEGIDRVRGI